MKRKSKHHSSSKRSPGFQAQAEESSPALHSYQIGAAPLINKFFQRMRLRECFEQHVPCEDKRAKVVTADALLILVRNLLLSREPMYGVGEWAAAFWPESMGLASHQIQHLNDDLFGRSLDRLFEHAGPDLLIDVMRHVVREFKVKLDELHNDSTSISFYGNYPDAKQEGFYLGHVKLAVTHGHSKAHRPDLKQLLYILTISGDGGIPVYFRAASGNTSDDTTHIESWNMVRELVGHSDFLYIADCKLVSTENLQYIHAQQGRFLSLLPKTRREDAEFRRRLREGTSSVRWRTLFTINNEQGEAVDLYQTCEEELATREGFRLLWIHSSRKARSDAASRGAVLERTVQELDRLNARLVGERTRFRDREQVSIEVNRILAEQGAHAWIGVAIEELEEVTLKQATPGRPGPDTKYTKHIRLRFRVQAEVDHEQIAIAAREDGVFPLITNELAPDVAELLRTYKRQSTIEKRFSQFKTDFEVAPVYLKSVTRIQALLCAYFFALLTQSLLERELRQSLADKDEKPLTLYPEGRECKRPTARKVCDSFEPIQRHELNGQIFITQLTEVQTRIVKLLGIATESYGR
jgi:transposase